MPEILLRLRHAAPGHLARDVVHDVVVTVEADHTARELAAALAGHVGADPASALLLDRAGVVAVPDDRVERLDLLSGDVVVLVPPGTVPGPHRRRACDGGVVLDVVAGPEAGASYALPPGRSTIGRSRDAEVTVSDRAVSRRHAAVTVDERGVLLHPAHDAANGVQVNGVDVGGPTPIASTDVVTVGATRLTIRRIDPSGDRMPTGRLGRIDFHRTPYRPVVVARRDVAPFGPVPDRPEPRRFQLVAALAPLAAGLAMYAITRQVQFLALTLISPLVMVGSTVEDRRSGRRAMRARVAGFRRELDEHCRRLAELRDRERIERFDAAPDLAELIRRARRRSVDLWPRGRTAPDLLALRLGLGADTVRFAVDVAPGGADDLRAEAVAALEGLDRVDDVPIVVDLAVDAVVGLHGAPDVVDGVAASLLVQAAVLHSPEDLVIAAAVAPHRSLHWTAWLPHTRAVGSPLAGAHVVHGRDDADHLVGRLLEVAAFRAGSGELGRPAPAPWPRLLLVLDASLAPEPVAVARLLDVARHAGVAVIWLADSVADVPRQATRTLALDADGGATIRGRLWATDPDVADVTAEVDRLGADLADEVARALTPVRDASTASEASSIPRIAPLLDVLGVGRPSPAWVAEHWTHRRGSGLSFPIGVGANGPVEIDLVEDGPHTLIGGTSGAGKSELLQSMVASLAVHHSPARLNFLFVDYKGGASSQVFERLPHTVGYVTNLDAELALRALTSLRAELQRRMSILEGRAKDLTEMLEVAPDEAPASLVIVVDEFATLVKEVPEFVTGIVDIAQRGRSLGIHLVLATQRPSGSVDENILANTNLRISLRMLDRTESTAVIGAPDAADIPVPLRGRGFLRLGPRRLVEFQSPFAGAPLTAVAMRAPITVADLRTGGAAAIGRAAPSPTAAVVTEETHLSSVLDAIVEADRRLGSIAPRRPWREVLPDVVVLADVLAHPGAEPAHRWPGRIVAVGMIDEPEHQDQRPALLDLERSGGCLVFGSGGAGKTTLLRTVAASVAATGGDAAALVVFDLAGRGLTHLRDLPCVVDVATGDDLESVTRQLLVLDAELERRRRLLADAGAEHLTAYARDHADVPPRIVVLIDGFGGLAGTLLDGRAGEEWGDRIVRLVTDGRQVGIHTVITADRRNAVPARVHAAIGDRIVLRHADESAYADHGVSAARAQVLAGPVGRALLGRGSLAQIASVSSDPSARSQAAAVAQVAGSRRGRPAAALRSSALPSLVAAPTHRSGSVSIDAIPLGVGDLDGATVELDLTWSHAVVAGPARSGRSTTLATVVASLRADASSVPVVVGPAASPLRDVVDGPDVGFGGVDEVYPVLERLANRLALDGPAGPRRVLVVDDADLLDDPAFAGVFERIARCDTVRVVMALEMRALSGFHASPLVQLAKRARRVLLLQPDDPSEVLQATGAKISLRPGLRLPPGRGVLIADRAPTFVQVWSPEPSTPPATPAALPPPQPELCRA